MIEDRRRIIGARTGRGLATQDNRGAVRNGIGHLFMQFVAQLAFGHGSEIDAIVAWVADFEFAGAFLHAPNELIGDFRHDDESFRGDARLAAIQVAGRDGLFHREIEVGVVQDDERVGAAQFEYAFL